MKGANKGHNIQEVLEMITSITGDDAQPVFHSRIQELNPETVDDGNACLIKFNNG